jgi:cell division protein FtsB
VLTDEERSFSEAGLRPLKREEIGAAALAQMQQTRARLQTLEAERDALLARRQQVEAEIARLEAALLS